ncbi:transcription initiation factor TFIID subunit 11 [Microplitis mediator]|uniref:transcription initiation factor TFIID subunit 11 n=1 Tax=Microplitis mediator TaxID=375433 RepID=UPI002555B3B2|nr:transcription initiation factor TFIID subunit 11 [Microplitis mediator]XP_057335212.1 transcription initiation factor TFIID subunit 11 [Microplitis mediator]
MDDLFGKDDSGNDSDVTDEKSNNLSGDKLDDSIDIEEHDIKPEIDRSLLSPSPTNSPIKNNDCNLNSIVSPTDKNTSGSNDRNEIMDIDHIDHPSTSTSTNPSTSAGTTSTTANKNNNNDNNDDDIMTIGNNKEDDLFTNSIVLPQQQLRPMDIGDRRESKEKNKRELEEEEREKMQVLVSNFTEAQLDRYEMFRRAAFPKAAIKRIMQTITGCSVSQNVVIAMSGIAKVFVGEIVEKALDVMEEYNDSGPVQPKHLREAVRQLRLQGQIPIGRSRKTFFRL